MVEENTPSNQESAEESLASNQAYDYFEVTMNVDTRKSSITPEIADSLAAGLTNVSLSSSESSSQNEGSTETQTTTEIEKLAEIPSTSRNDDSSENPLAKLKQEEYVEESDDMSTFRDTVISGAKKIEPSRKSSSQEITTRK